MNAIRSSFRLLQRNLTEHIDLIPLFGSLAFAGKGAFPNFAVRSVVDPPMYTSAKLNKVEVHPCFVGC